jgi:hypothetical protein
VRAEEELFIRHGVSYKLTLTISASPSVIPAQAGIQGQSVLPVSAHPWT